MKADFEAFTKESGKVQGDVNHYNISSDKTLTDRAKEVMQNICDFVMSYNFDDSDPMTDHFHTNFYLTLGDRQLQTAIQSGTARTQEQRQTASVQASGRSGTRLCGRHWAKHALTSLPASGFPEN